MEAYQHSRIIINECHGERPDLDVRLGNRAAWVAAALSVPFFLYIAVYTAPAAQLILQKQERDAIERENLAFCEKHEMAFGTREYALCADDLMDIRAKQDRRTAEDMERIF